MYLYQKKIGTSTNKQPSHDSSPSSEQHGYAAAPSKTLAKLFNFANSKAHARVYQLKVWFSGALGL